MHNCGFLFFSDPPPLRRELPLDIREKNSVLTHSILIFGENGTDEKFVFLCLESIPEVHRPDPTRPHLRH